MSTTARELQRQREWAEINVYSYHSPYLELQDMLNERITRINEVLLLLFPDRHYSYCLQLIGLRKDHIEEMLNIDQEFSTCQCEDHL